MVSKSAADYTVLIQVITDPSEWWKLRKMILRENYQVEFGIQTQAQIDNTPFATVSVQPAMSIYDDIHLKDLIRQFIDTGVHESTGMQLQDFIRSPQWLRDNVLSVIREHARQKDTLVADILAQAEANKQ